MQERISSFTLAFWSIVPFGAPLTVPVTSASLSLVRNKVFGKELAMAFRDSASIQSSRVQTSLLRSQRESSSVNASYPEPEVASKWHPATTLAFIVVSCCLLWAGIFFAFRLLF